jgi:hypothetical protein
VFHHPDRRAHEAYAAAHAGRGNVGEVRRFLAALEAPNPDLAARLAAAKAFRQENNWSGAIAMLREALTPERLASQKELAPEALVLLADSQCSAGECAAGRETLESGLRLFPDNKAIKEAVRKLKMLSRSTP